MKQTATINRSMQEENGTTLASAPARIRVKGRIDAIDLARGIAVALMILSHGVNGLLSFEDIPGWGMIPIHLVTKFSSSLFIIVFGVALAIAYLPHVYSPDWPRRRMKMLLSGVVIFFWYKILTIFEMLYLAEPHQILNTLLFGSFPSYVEILGFYAIALLWTPFFLVLWARIPLYLRIASPLILIMVYLLLSNYFHFWNIEPLRAILIEHEDYYTWGQISRGPLVLLGLLIGELTVAGYSDIRTRKKLISLLMMCSFLLLTAFLISAAPNLSQELLEIARNEGKHPPEVQFMLFSTSGALFILSICLLGGGWMARILRPFTIIGTDALKAFVFHIFVIFVGFRYLMGYYHDISYLHALALALLLIPATASWISVTSWIEKKRR